MADHNLITSNSSSSSSGSLDPFRPNRSLQRSPPPAGSQSEDSGRNKTPARGKSPVTDSSQSQNQIKRLRDSPDQEKQREKQRKNNQQQQQTQEATRPQEVDNEHNTEFRDEFIDILTHLNMNISREKSMAVDKKNYFFEKLGKLQKIFIDMSTELTTMKVENRTIKKNSEISRSYAVATSTV